MNYLAHIYLSGTVRKRQLGNYIGDAVKGKNYEGYPLPIAQGILFHRAIDDFTDNHPVVRELVLELRPHFGRYSAILLDIYFDYFLASHFGTFSTTPLSLFAKNFYVTLILNYRHLPARFKSFMWHFILTDRLSKYARPEGIRQSLEIMVEYRNLDISVDEAMTYLKENEDYLFNRFVLFFKEIQSFSINYLDRL